MQTQVSQEVLRILAYAKEEAMRTGDYSISPDHILLGILRHRDNDACRILEALGVDLEEMKNCVEGSIFRPKHIAWGEADTLVFSRSAQNTLNLCIVEATIAASDRIIATHLLLAISSSSGSASIKYLKSVGLDHSVISAYAKKEGLLCARKVDLGDAGSSHPVSILKIISSPEKIAS